jgi:hypothetical protein
MAVTLNALTTGVGGLQTTGDTSGAIQLQSNGTATLTVDSSGNVGVGTVTPNTIFDVNATTPRVSLSVSGALKAQMNVASSAFNITSNDVTFPITLNAGGAERLRINTAGEIGLGGANYGTSGQFLTSGGPGAGVSWTTAAAGGFSNMTVFASPGTFTTPASTTRLKVTVVGGGGGGGGGPSNNGGGGGGGAAIYVGPVSASTGYAVTVGTGGPGGTSPANGTAGNTSSFASLASATGGSGGKIAPLGNDSAGGAGGAGSAGTLQITGNGAMSGAAPPPGIGVGGSGGGSFLGGGGRGTGTNAPSPGVAGGNYGGGGSGGGQGANGGAGAGGVVVVEY